MSDEDAPPPEFDGDLEGDMVVDPDDTNARQEQDDEDAIAPPDELPADFVPDYATPAAAGGTKVSAFGAVPLRTRQRKPRTASLWAAGPVAQEATLATAPSLFISKPAMAVKNSLRYCTMMKPNPAPLFSFEREALDDALATYLNGIGFTRTLTALKNARDSSVPEPGFGTPLTRHLTLATERSSALFDDETPWRSDTFFLNEWPLLTLEDRGKANQFGTIDRLIEKLVLEESNAPLQPRAVDINFTTVFLTLGPSFVCVPVFLSRLFKLFKTLSLHGTLLGESKTIRWQTRVLQVMAAYLSCNRIDVTRVEAERALSFLISVAHTGGQHPSVIREANASLDVVKAIGFEDGVAPPRWQTQPCVSTAGARDLMAPRAGVLTSMADEDRIARADIVFALEQTSEQNFAEQLTLVQYELFMAVAIREFTNGAWCDPLLKHGAAPNLLRLLSHRERLVLWIATLIITPVELARRQAVYARVVRIAKVLFNGQNYFGAEALLAALEHGAVRKLHNTTLASAMNADEVESLSVLQAMFEPFNGKVKNIPFNLTSPCIPVLHSYLSELARTHETQRTIVYKELKPSDLATLGLLPTTAGDAGRSQAGATTAKDAQQQGGGNSISNSHNSNAVSELSNSSVEGATALVNWSKVVITAKTALRVVSYQSLPYEYTAQSGVLHFIRGTPGWRKEDSLYELASERMRANGG